MTGADNVLRHVPEWQSQARRLAAVALAVAMFALATAAMIVIDLLWPAWTMLGQIGTLLIGFAWAGQFFWRRKEYGAKWGEHSYHHAFLRHITPGLPLIFAAIAHTAYVPGVRVVTGWFAPIVSMIGLYLVITGLVVWARGGRAIGSDYGLMLYVYFPEESRIVNSAIYAILRHPMYSGAVRVGLALGLWRGTFWSILFGFFMPIGLTIWLWFVEEPELIERFGDGYREYRRKVPAFWPRLKDTERFWHFLIVGDRHDSD